MTLLKWRDISLIWCHKKYFDSDKESVHDSRQFIDGEVNYQLKQCLPWSSQQDISLLDDMIISKKWKREIWHFPQTI